MTIRISIMYPNTKGAHLDMEYYLQRHMPMSIEKLSQSKGFKGVSVERGVGGEIPGSEPPYIALCQYLFDSIEDFVAAFSQHAALLQGDMPHYTDIKPLIQFSAVEITQ